MRKGLDNPKTNDEAPENERLLHTLRLLVAEVLVHDNADLTVECLALVCGLHHPGVTMSSIARCHEISRAAVSKRCGQMRLVVESIFRECA